MAQHAVVPRVWILPKEHGSQGNKLATFPAWRPKQQQSPVWRLADEENLDLSCFEGRVLDVSYSSLPDLRGVAAAPSFEWLTVLSLKEMGLENIELLRHCTMLVYLDLSSNEISDQIDEMFWTFCPDLLVLLLHGNKIKDWRTTISIGRVPRLTYLTLFYNPVSTMKMYRTFTANYCESLRALDRHVVSDEEVIEGAEFPPCSRYQTCSATLALPSALFGALTEIPLASRPIRHWGGNAGLRRSGAYLDPEEKNHPSSRHPFGDDEVLASVTRRVEVLQKFHSGQSPVILLQRQIRRFLLEKVIANAVVKIQACVRMWIVTRRAMKQLTELLRTTGELYLIQEMMTPAQIRSLVHFQQSIVGFLRVKVRKTCARKLELFVCRMKKIFSSFVACIERAKIGGVVVASTSAGELASAVAQALMVTTPHVSKEEATRRATATVVVVPNCRLLRPFSYVSMSDWPFLREEARTDGIFTTRSLAAGGSVSSRYSPALGLFQGTHVRRCKIRRRGVSICCPRRAVSTEASFARIQSREQLWVFRPEDASMLARVLCAMRDGRSGRPPVPNILERHMLRCAAATRVQAAWRGHVCRWNLLAPLTSCMMVSRAVICLQRWWRYLRGLARRLRLCRRLWALAAAIYRPVLYMEHDVYCTLTRGWLSSTCSDHGIQLALHRDGTVGVVQEPMEAETRRALTDEANRPGTLASRATPRQLPLWVYGDTIPYASEETKKEVVRQVGSLLTEGVEVKRVVWPVPAESNSCVPAEKVGHDRGANHDSVTTGAEDTQSCNSYIEKLEFSSAGTCLGSEAIATCQIHGLQSDSQKSTGGRSTLQSVDLRKSHGCVDMVQLTFASAQEARARALLVAFATEEFGFVSNQPIAQLMTFEMLQKAAAGKPGQSTPILLAPAHGYECGDNVEISMLRLSEGFGGSWYPGVINRDNGDGKFKVILDNGGVESSVPMTCLRPFDRTGKEYALVEISNLPSKWQCSARNNLTPSQRVESELLRRTLPLTTPTTSSLTVTPRAPTHAHLSSDEDGNSRGVFAGDLDRLPVRDVHKYDPEARPLSQGEPLGPNPSQLHPSIPRWEGSTNLSTTRNGAVAAGGVGEVARAVAVRDRFTTASTWVPGNRFRRDLEKLVSLAAQEAQDAVVRESLELKRQAVVLAKGGGTNQDDLTPRQRLERVKAAEIAIFRREVAEQREITAAENAANRRARSNAVLEAREHERDGAETARLGMQVMRANQVADIRRREEEVGEERERERARRQGDVEMAKYRERRRRTARTRQMATRDASNAFTANASELIRHVRKHTSACYKTQVSEGMKQWVKGQKKHKDEMRRSLLQRVKELQKRKRLEAVKQRKVLTARSKMRVAMDEAMLRHRIGDSVRSTDKLGHDIMQVLRPSTARAGFQRRSDDPETVTNGGEHASQSPDDYRNDTGWNLVDGLSRSEQPPAASGGTATNVHVDGAGGHSDDGTPKTAAECIPTRPNGSKRSCSPPQQTSRYLRRADGTTGKTVVVLASVPTATSASPTKLTRGASRALFGSKSSNSMASIKHQPRGVGREPSSMSTQPNTMQELPWPMGRRRW